MRSRSVLHARRSTTLELWYGKKNPDDGLFFDSTKITAASIRILAADGTEILAPTAMTFVANLKGWRFSWTYGANLDGRDLIYVFITPTRDASVAAALAPDELIPIDVSDVEKEVEEFETTAATQASVAALQTDFDAFEIVNQNEHDDTQAKIDQIGAAANAQLIGPTELTVPDAGTMQYALEFVLKDLDLTPVALVDPDANQVDIAVVDETGIVPVGITLAGTPAGRMTRDAAGRYSLVVTVGTTGVVGKQLRWTATFAQGGVTNIAKATSRLVDVDPQLGRVEADVDTLVARLTAQRATNLDNLDATVSTRSSHSAADVWAAATRTLTSIAAVMDAHSYTAARAALLDNLDAAVSSRSSHAASDVDTVLSASHGASSWEASSVPRNVALAGFSFVMLDSTDHVSPKTGLTVTAERSKDGGAFAAMSNAVAEIGSGAYKIDVTAPELDAKIVMLKFTAAGADQRLITIVTA